MSIANKLKSLEIQRLGNILFRHGIFKVVNEEKEKSNRFIETFNVLSKSDDVRRMIDIAGENILKKRMEGIEAFDVVEKAKKELTKKNIPIEDSCGHHLSSYTYKLLDLKVRTYHINIGYLPHIKPLETNVKKAIYILKNYSKEIHRIQEELKNNVEFLQYVFIEITKEGGKK